MPVVAPVVTTKSSVTLADHLDLRNLPLATTPGGRAFAMKSLHPADSEIKTVRGPGGLYPSLGIAFDSIMTIPWPEGATYAVVIQWPNLMVPFNVQFHGPIAAYADATDVILKNYLVINKALDTTAGSVNSELTPILRDHFVDLAHDIDAYRVMSQSVTCEVVAPAVADQGTIVSAQVVDRPRTLNQSYLNWTYSSSVPHDVWSNTVGGFTSDCWIYDDIPDPDNLVMGTTAYSGSARQGFYQPLKIDKFDFVSVDDPMYFYSPDSGAPLPAVTLDRAAWHLGGAGNYNPYYGNYPIATSQGWDHEDHHKFSSRVEQSILKPSGYAIGYTRIAGTAGYPNVSLKFRFRQVSEILPVIGRRFAALAEAPFPPDDLSYRMVREIGARLKDAYPASYNDLSKLKEVIAKLGKGLLKYADPALTLVSTVAPQTAPAVAGVRTVLDGAKLVAAAVKRSRRRRKGNGVAQAPPPPTQPAPLPPPFDAPGRKRRRNRRAREAPF